LISRSCFFSWPGSGPTLRGGPHMFLRGLTGDGEKTKNLRTPPQPPCKNKSRVVGGATIRGKSPENAGGEKKLMVAPPHHRPLFCKSEFPGPGPGDGGPEGTPRPAGARHAAGGVGLGYGGHGRGHSTGPSEGSRTEKPAVNHGSRGTGPRGPPSARADPGPACFRSRRKRRGPATTLPIFRSFGAFRRVVGPAMDGKKHHARWAVPRQGRGGEPPGSPTPGPGPRRGPPRAHGGQNWGRGDGRAGPTPAYDHLRAGHSRWVALARREW